MLSGCLVIVFLLSAFITPTLSYAKNTTYKYSKTTVNIRVKPNTKSKIVGQLHFNDKVLVVESVNKKWDKIKHKGKIRYVASKYFNKKKAKYKSFSSPSNKTFKSYEDADCMTDNPKIPQGKLKKEYTLDAKSGVWKVGNRYCIAIGSYYTRKIGVKVDLVLSHNGKKHILKCITADGKADKDTIDNHKIHRDGSIVEFVVKTSSLPSKARRMGDVSYAGNQFKGSIKKLKVYQK